MPAFPGSASSFPETAVVHPFVEACYPGADRFQVPRAQSKAVATCAVDVQFRRHTRAFESEISFSQSFRDVFAVRVRASQENGWESVCRLDVSGTAGINQRLKIRAAGLALNRIACAGRAIVKARAHQVH